MAIILLKIIFFKKFQKPYLDREWGNDISSWQCSSGSDKPVKQYGRQTGIAKNLDTFWQKLFVWIFFVNLFVYMQKEFWFYLPWFSHNYSSKLLINLKENQTKGHNSGNKQFFKNLRKPFLAGHLMNRLQKIWNLYLKRCSRNWKDKHTHTATHI